MNLKVSLTRSPAEIYIIIIDFVETHSHVLKTQSTLFKKNLRHFNTLTLVKGVYSFRYFLPMRISNLPMPVFIMPNHFVIC